MRSLSDCLSAGLPIYLTLSPSLPLSLSLSASLSLSLSLGVAHRTEVVGVQHSSLERFKAGKVGDVRNREVAGGADHIIEHLHERKRERDRESEVERARQKDRRRKKDIEAESVCAYSRVNCV